MSCDFGTCRICDKHTKVSCAGRFVLKVTTSEIMNIIFFRKNSLLVKSFIKIE